MFVKGVVSSRKGLASQPTLVGPNGEHLPSQIDRRRCLLWGFPWFRCCRLGSGTASGTLGAPAPRAAQLRGRWKSAEVLERFLDSVDVDLAL